MKGKLIFLIIPSRSGRRRRFSVSRNFIACMIILSLLLAGSGIWGALKFSENLELKKRCLTLEVEKSKFEAVSRKIQAIEKDGDAVRRLLGLQTAGGEDDRTSRKQPPETAEQE